MKGLFASHKATSRDVASAEIECGHIASSGWRLVSFADCHPRCSPSWRPGGERRIFTYVFLSCNISLVKPLELLGQARSRDGTVLKLIRRSDEYIILANGKSLMSSRMHGSEEALATFACREARALEQPSVLIGGLGMGFTLRATLDLLPPDAMVVVAELAPAVVDWNRGPLGLLAGEPLKDTRVRVEIDDVAVTLSSRLGQFDAVLLDVDNGPAAFTASNNAGLYDDR
ncbi:MAG TPA: hypothetical protein VNE63_17960, partial [Candidatus Acidoferrales bacterium]|nr:hypothetical protein [Candidatus Acidoferrales bacterium]